MGIKIIKFKNYSLVVFLSLISVIVCSSDASVESAALSIRNLPSPLSVTDLSSQDLPISDMTQPSAKARDLSRNLKRLDKKVWAANTLTELNDVISEIIIMKHEQGDQFVSGNGDFLTVRLYLFDLLEFAETRKKSFCQSDSLN